MKTVKKMLLSALVGASLLTSTMCSATVANNQLNLGGIQFLSGPEYAQKVYGDGNYGFQGQLFPEEQPHDDGHFKRIQMTARLCWIMVPSIFITISRLPRKLSRAHVLGTIWLPVLPLLPITILQLLWG